MGSPDRDRWALVAAAGLAIFMAQLDATIVNVALPALGQRLHANPAAVQWVVLGYVLPLIALSLLAGRWLDRAGHRAALTLAATGFAAASTAAGAAPSLGWLVTARVVQGGFAAVLLALAVTLAVGAVRPEMRGRALGIMSGIAPLGALSGPWLGGELVQHAGWRAIFYLSVPVAVAVAALGRSQLPAGGSLRPPDRAWLAEAALLGGAAAAVVLALSLAAGYGAGWLALGLAAAPLAWAWRRTPASRPVLRLLATHGVGGAHAALVLSYTALMIVQFLAPFYLARVAGSPPSEIGTALLAYPAGAAASGPLSGLIADKAGPRRVAVAGAAVLTASLALVVPLSPGWGPAGLAWRLAIAGLGFGWFMTAVQSMVMFRVVQDQRSTASASTNLARQLGMALGPALASVAWAGSGYATSGMRAGIAAAVMLSAAVVVVLARSGATSATYSRPGNEPSPYEGNSSVITSVKVAVIYYSATGNVHALARAVSEGAEKAGGEVRLRRVAELALAEAIDANPAWRAHADATADLPVATHDDLRWADAYAFGTPTRFGNVAAQLKQFLDTTAGLWAAGELSDKAVTAFTSAINTHGGNESTLLALYNTMHHWGAVIVPPGYTDSAVGAAGGNPYGTAHPSGGGQPGDAALAAARYQGSRLVRIGGAVAAARAELN